MLFPGNTVFRPKSAIVRENMKNLPKSPEFYRFPLDIGAEIGKIGRLGRLFSIMA